ncbi:MAG: hypothetical protein CSA29_01680 [Desulfobacterales bacterium]|nr:MAG: hypothetical protein CSA29_01680 [Desulfobacterales bacterium]
MAKRREWIIVAVCILLTTTAFGFGMYLIPMVLPEMTSGLGLDYARIGTITGGSQVAALLAIPMADLVVRRFGALSTIITAHFSAALLLAGVYDLQGFLDFFCLSFLLRTWPVMTWIPMVVVAAEHLPLNWRPTFFTLVSAASCVCVSFDGFFSSWFLTHSNWRAMWMAASMINVGVGLISLAALKCCGALGGPSKKTMPTQTSPGEGLTAWLKSPGGILLNAIFLISGLTFISFPVYLAPYLREELNTGLSTITLMWSVMGLAGIPAGLIFSVIVARMGIKFSFVLIFTLGITAAACLGGAPAMVPMTLSAASFGTAQAVIYGMGPAYLSKVLSVSAASKAFALGTAIMTIGGLIGNFLGGWSSDLLGSFKWAYMATGILFAVGALLSILLVPKSLEPTGNH